MSKWTILLIALAAIALLTLDALARPRLGKGAAAKPGAAAGLVVRGSVVNSDGAAVGAGIEVSLVEPQGKGQGGQGGKAQGAAKRKVIETATTDAKGKFAFLDVQPGRYAVVARDKGVGHGRVAAVVDQASLTGLVVTLEKGRTHAPKA